MLYRFDNIKKSFGPHDVLAGATWQHNPGERVGLVGRNGAGKTTIFKLLLGQEDLDSGSIMKSSTLTVGHLGQHLETEPDTSLFDFVLGAFTKVLKIESAMREIEHELAVESADHDALLEKYSVLQHDYEHENGYTVHSEVERVLSGIGFAKEEWERPILAFSGGQQNRAMLARVLLTRVDVLLLDEPTNHLDLRGIEFLEEFLQSFRGSYLLISHDRTFLNRTVDKIVELTHGKLIEYPGNYEKFLELRSERMEQMRTEFERQQEMIEKTEDFIRRNIAGQKTKQAQSRRKMLARLDEVERPQTDETLARFNMEAGPRSGAVALTVDDLSAGYPGRTVVEHLHLTIRRGERYAIMGPNGSGKSTVLKTIAGRLAPLAGEVRYGHNVQLGYYDQTLGDLRLDGQVVDEVWDLDHSQTEEQVRSYLARFSFFGDDVYKKVRSLSGGERGRLALAKIMYVGGNVMLLDEPTNHLDVYTREALEEALEGFTGALVVVSHDRYFVDRVAEHLLIVEDGEAEIHNGNYTEVVEKLKAASGTPKPIVTPKMQKAAPAQGLPSRDEQKKRDKRIRKIADEIKSAETRIGDLEKQREVNDLLLCSEEVYRDGNKARSIQEANETIKAQLEKLYRTWDDLAAEKESLEEALSS
ncbi:MAG TPA: ABC-F family ATP-binding cassette domain-containing protein [Thermoanaerobaculia bacterium]|nr:ABC-F family ATP-binding cassette domain-containing protein [Thermoanaerobaculia bacterium]